MRVRMLKSAITDRGTFTAGDIPLVPDDVAVDWIKAGLAQAVRIDPPDTTDDPAARVETATLPSPPESPEPLEPPPGPDPDPEPLTPPPRLRPALKQAPMVKRKPAPRRRR